MSVYKPANKSIKLRLTCQFEYTTRCYFESTVIGLPYATKFREGVVRFAKDKDDPQKANTVYSGDYVEQRIEAVIEAGVDLTKYVLWDTSGDDTNTGDVTLEQIKVVDDLDNVNYSTVITQSSSGLEISGTVTGNAVASSPVISSGAITSSNKLVNDAYIASLYANEVSDANNTKLVTSYANNHNDNPHINKLVKLLSESLFDLADNISQIPTLKNCKGRFFALKSSLDII